MNKKIRALKEKIAAQEKRIEELEVRNHLLTELLKTHSIKIPKIAAETDDKAYLDCIGSEKYILNELELMRSSFDINNRITLHESARITDYIYRIFQEAGLISGNKDDQPINSTSSPIRIGSSTEISNPPEI